MEEKKGKPFVFPVMKKSIEELFKNGTTSKDDLERFQEKYWEQMVPNFSQALKLLDIHDVSRHSVLWNINDRLLEAVKSRIQAKAMENNDEKKQQKLWQKLIRTGMVYIHHPYMRSAIMMVLGQMNSIKSRHVSLIIDNDYLYKDAPLPVLRHIWMNNQNKFKEEMMNVLRLYQTSISDSLLDPLLSSITSANADILPILYWPPRRRRRDPSLIKLVEMIGENETLYDKALEILREENIRCQEMLEKSTHKKLSTTGEISSSKRQTESSPIKSGKFNFQKKDDGPPHFFISPALLPTSQSLAAALLCTIRFDILMSFNEAKLDRICVTDPIHHFVWCMDACIKSKKIDFRHASELASHLKRHRKRQPTQVPSLEIGLDQDTSDDWVPETEEKSSGRRKAVDFKSCRPQRAGEKRTFSILNEDENTEQAKSDQPISNFERDIQTVCRDPWVVYTVCSSLIRLVITGLYEDRSPRNIPEVPFLVHLLMLGLGCDLTPPEVASADPPKLEPRKKRPRKHSTSEPSEAQPPKPDPATVLITQVLPAVAQLHLATWRSQVCEEIRNSTNKLWPKGGATDSGPHPCPPPSWKRRLEAAVAPPVSVPPTYLASPVGHLFLQYHALFALERREWTVLRALLKAAAGAAQVLSSKGSRATKTPASPPATSPTQSQLTVGFRWRPECLQALSLGIASLPVSSEESGANAGAVSSTGASESAVSEKTSSAGTDSQPSPVPGISLSSSPSSVVTRAELASLLRASLPLQSDLQLLVLAQSAKLVSSAAPSTTPGSTGPATPMPNFFASTELTISANSRSGSERERLINTLSRHVEYPQQEGAKEECVVASPPPSAGFKTSNPKVLEALEWLRRDLERTTSGNLIPMMSTSKSSFGKPQTPLSGPLSPLGGLQHHGGGSLASPARLMPPPTRFMSSSNAGRLAAGSPRSFPVATPLTNPGLSMPPPTHLQDFYPHHL